MRAGGACAGDVRGEAVLGRLGGLWRCAEQPGEPDRCGHAGDVAGVERALGRAGGEDRARARGACQPGLDLRAEELFLPGPAQRLPDQPVRASDRRPRPSADRPAGRPHQAHRHHPPASRDGCRQVAARPARGRDADRPQPLGRGLDGDRLRAGHPHARGGRAVHAQAALDPPLSRHLRRQHGGGLDALRRQCLGAQGRRHRARHALRDQERQLHALRRQGHRVRGQAPGRAARGRRQGGAGDPPVRRAKGRDPLDARQGGGARLPLLPRPRPACPSCSPRTSSRG